MPVHYKIFPDHKLVVIKCSGLVTDEGLIEGYRRLYEDDRFQPTFYELADLREASAFDVSVAGYQQLSDMTVAYHGDTECHTAIVCAEQATEIISRLYQTVAETFGSEIVREFTDLSAALRWLDRADFPVELIDS